MEEHYDIVNIVYYYDEQVYGTVEQIGAYASVIKYNKDGIDYEELIENDEFVVIENIVFSHVEEDSN